MLRLHTATTMNVVKRSWSNVVCLEYEEDCYFCFSGQRVSLGTDKLVEAKMEVSGPLITKPIVTMLVDVGGWCAEWNCGAGPVVITQRAPSGVPDTHPHYFFETAYVQKNWNQGIVERTGIKSSLVHGNFKHIFRVLCDTADGYRR